MVLGLRAWGCVVSMDSAYALLPPALSEPKWQAAYTALINAGLEQSPALLVIAYALTLRPRAVNHALPYWVAKPEQV